jgi:hypothetical protein
LDDSEPLEVAVARVAVRVVDFEDGALPRVCASSGDEATRLYRIRARHDPLWPLLLLFAGPIGWVAVLVISASVGRELHGYVPFSDAAHRRMVRSRQARMQVTVSALVGMVVTAFSLAVLGRGSAAVGVGIIGLLVAAVGGLAAMRPAGSVGASLNPNSRTVDLSGVSRRFVERYEDQEAARRAERQARLRSADRTSPQHVGTSESWDAP